MAKVDVRMPEDFLLKVSKLAEQSDVIIPKVLEVGGEVVLAKVKDNLRSVVGKGTKYPSKSTGELVSSLGVTSAKQDRKGNYNVKVGFQNREAMVVAMQKLLISLNMVNMGSLQGHF